MTDLSTTPTRLDMYELAKSEWIAQHPEAGYIEYTEAMKALAAECGI